MGVFAGAFAGKVTWLSVALPSVSRAEESEMPTQLKLIWLTMAVALAWAVTVVPLPTPLAETVAVFTWPPGAGAWLAHQTLDAYVVNDAPLANVAGTGGVKVAKSGSFSATAFRPSNPSLVMTIL